MKKIAQFIYSFFEWLDNLLGLYKSFSYETAPYCGHHFNGHNGLFTQSNYHEGMGGKNIKSRFLKLGQCTESGWYFYLNFSLGSGVRIHEHLFYKDDHNIVSKAIYFHGWIGNRSGFINK